MNVRELFNLSDSVAIVTGGSSGIGLQLAEGLAEAGSNLVITSRNINKCENVCKDFMARYKGDALPIRSDVTKEEDVINLIQKTIKHYGKLDIRVNNVGNPADVPRSDTISTTLKDWHHVVDLNLTSTFLTCREAGKLMIKQKYGKIINIGSVYGIRGCDWRNYVDVDKTLELLHYSSSKGAIVSLTRDLAVNWARYNITVNMITPSVFLSEGVKDFVDDDLKQKIKYRIPVGRWGEDDDLKGAVVFLASKASKYVTGHNLVVDGGWSCWC